MYAYFFFFVLLSSTQSLSLRSTNNCKINGISIPDGLTKDIPTGLVGASYQATCDDGKPTCYRKYSILNAKEEEIPCNEIPKNRTDKDCRVNGVSIANGITKDIPTGLTGASYQATCHDGKPTCYRKYSILNAKEEEIPCNEIPKNRTGKDCRVNDVSIPDGTTKTVYSLPGAKYTATCHDHKPICYIKSSALNAERKEFPCNEIPKGN